MLSAPLRIITRVSTPKAVGRAIATSASSVASRPNGARSSHNDSESSGRRFSRFGLFGAAAAVAVGGASVFAGLVSADDKKKERNLDPNNFQKFPLVKIVQITHDVKAYTFALGSPETVLDMPVASYVLVKTPLNDKDGKPIVRPYTPISASGTKGQFTLTVKSYPNGAVSKYLDGLKVGDEVEIKGPMRKLEYKPNMKKHIGMIAGGTGITPMVQVLKEIFKNEDDQTEVTLIFANKAPKDLFLERILGNLERTGRLQTVLLFEEGVDEPIQRPAYKDGEKTEMPGIVSGRVSLDLVKEVLPPPSDDTLIMVCGPPPMVAAVAGSKAPDYTQGELSGILKEAGYTKEQVFKF